MQKTIGMMTDFEILYYDVWNYLLFPKKYLISADNKGLVQKIAILILSFKFTPKRPPGSDGAHDVTVSLFLLVNSVKCVISASILVILCLPWKTLAPWLRFLIMFWQEKVGKWSRG